MEILKAKFLRYPLKKNNSLKFSLHSDKVKKFIPHGTKIDEFKVEDETFVIYSADDSIPGFREYHSKLQPWIMFYIDAASYIGKKGKKLNENFR